MCVFARYVYFYCQGFLPVVAAFFWQWFVRFQIYIYIIAGEANDSKAKNNISSEILSLWSTVRKSYRYGIDEVEMINSIFLCRLSINMCSCVFVATIPVCVGYKHIYMYIVQCTVTKRDGSFGCSVCVCVCVCMSQSERDCLSVVWLSYHYQFVWLDIEGNGINEMNHSKTHHLYIHLFQIPVLNRSFSFPLSLFIRTNGFHER